MLLVRVEEVVVLHTPTSSPMKFILEYIGTVGDFGCIVVLVKHPMWYHILVGIILLVILVVLHLVLVIIAINVVLVLGSPTFPTIKLIVGLMVFILCHLRVGCLQYHFSKETSQHYPSWLM